MQAPARLETSRLILRQPEPADVEAIFARYTSDADVTRYLDIRRLFAECHHQHRASQRVLEKCGFQRAPGALKSRVFPNLGVTQPVLSYWRLL